MFLQYKNHFVAFLLLNEVSVVILSDYRYFLFIYACFIKFVRTIKILFLMLILTCFISVLWVSIDILSVYRCFLFIYVCFLNLFHTILENYKKFISNVFEIFLIIFACFDLFLCILWIFCGNFVRICKNL